MGESIKSVTVDRLHRERVSVSQFGGKNAKKVQDFHRSFPEYSVTPLVDLSLLANYLDVCKVYVKDESYRFGLNAFKGLGGSYCLGRYAAEKLGLDISELSFDMLRSAPIREALGDLTFVTATDGNHGRGIAWAAAKLGFSAVVYLPKGSSAERLNNIRALGAEASITDVNYDDTVRYAEAQAERNGWVLVQDTAWEGYETIPGWIMEGYTTMGQEIVDQLGGERPTHVFLQAGVGAMAGALTGFFADYYGAQDVPSITIVEPERADCIFRTAEAHDGRLRVVTGDLDTIMAGLACGEPCTIGWDVLNGYADHFVSVPDHIAAKGMRVLGNPLVGDDRVISGESGAVTLGLVFEVLHRQDLRSLKDELGLGCDSRILCISTEGDTDQENYRRVVWDGP